MENFTGTKNYYNRMLALGENNLYDFRLQTLTDVEQLLLRFKNEKERMMQTNIAVMPKIYAYLEVIEKTLNSQITNKPLLALNQAAIGFLDKDLMEIVLNDPTDKEMRDALSLELVLVGAAINAPLQAITPYTPEDMQAVLKGKEDVYYDDIVFTYSLRQFFEANVSGSLFSLMVKTLPSVLKEPENLKTYYWSDAFVLTMLLHSIWRHFFLLPQVDQQFILQNYFYQSIVLGVPVKFALQETLQRASVKGEGEKMVRFLRENLALGKETIPTTIDTAQGKTVADVSTEFLTKAATEQINTLVQEKYISDMYRGQIDNEYFSFWLRQALTIIWQLKSGDIFK